MGDKKGVLIRPGKALQFRGLQQMDTEAAERCPDLSDLRDLMAKQTTHRFDLLSNVVIRPYPITDIVQAPHIVGRYLPTMLIVTPPTAAMNEPAREKGSILDRTSVDQICDEMGDENTPDASACSGSAQDLIVKGQIVRGC
jgi:hypothetical protein